LGIIFNAFYHVDFEGEASSIAQFSLMYMYPLPSDGRMERPKRRAEIIIKARLVFGCCICVN
jgi:hypothetical protein